MAIVGERRVLLSSKELNLLKCCGGFRTHDEHVATAARVVGIPESEASALLEGLIEKRLVVGETQIVDHLRLSRDNVDIGILGIITRDRPAALAACVASYIRNASAFGHQYELVVIDDSCEPSNRAANKALLAGFSSNIHIRYAGPDQRKAFCSLLAQHGLDSNTLQYGLLQSASSETPGAARNCLLLDSIGSKLLSVDDDTLARSCINQDRADGLALVGHENPFDYSFFPTRDKALEHALWVDVDILSEHSSLLGTHLGPKGGLSVSSARPCAHFAQSLIGATFEVLFTLCGKVGDSGRSDWTWVLTLNQRDISSSAVLHNALTAREIAELPRQATITHGIGCVSTVVGLDNRNILPPFSPRFRGEDSVFSALLSAAAPNACSGVVAHAIVHNATQGRVYGEIKTYYSQVLHALIKSTRFISSSLDRTSRLQYIGDWLTQLRYLSRDHFETVVVKALASGLGSLMRDLEERARAYDCASFTEAATRVCRVYRSCLLGSESILPSEFEACGSNGWITFQSELSAFARLLILWPTIYEGAACLHNRGLRLSQPLTDAIG